jgi:hypothetical protein
MMMLRMIVAAVMVHGARCLRIAQHEIEPAIRRGQHETGRNQRAQAEHRENERRRPVACAMGPEPIRAACHIITMPKETDAIK